VAAILPRQLNARPDPKRAMAPEIVEITHVQEFAASHRLHNPSWSAEENRRVFGICNNENGHGHNWVVEVTVQGELEPESGMVMDLNRLRVLVLEKLIARVDHLHLNHDVPFLRGVNPTAENIARAFWRELEPSLEANPGCRLHRIRVRESRFNFVDYWGPTPTRRPS
jgi:6-pyruvoyltetrahydropterin/6-carboxytetrahydropterin synthase